jgi:uncharacterized membrane protein YraQ (UPF0718 family)
MNLDWMRFWLVLQDELLRMWWIFLLGVLVAAAIKSFKWDKKLRNLMRSYGKASIFLAVGTGLISPLCSCGIMPVVVSLIFGGVPLAPVFALLITSPLMSPDAFVLTAGILGRDYAVGKLLSAAVIGLAGGFAVLLMQRKGWIREQGLLGTERPDIREKCLDGAPPDDPRRGLEVTVNRWWYFSLMVKDMGLLIGKYLLIAIVIEAAIVAFVPVEWVRHLVGGDGPFSVLLATFAGVPIPLPQVAAVPVLKGLLAQGMDPGAAMAFLISGPVTSIPALVLLFSVFQRPVLKLYLGLSLVGAFLVGLFFQLMTFAGGG